jgi:F-type H+-transporting ATPase subunit delta
VRHAVTAVITFKRGGYLTLLAHFMRLVRLDRDRHTATIESAEPVPEDLRTEVEADLERAYGQGLLKQFVLNPELIGGMRVRVGSDVFDRSVRSGISELRRVFGIVSPNGRNSPVG